MDVVLLGTGFPVPHAERAGPATLVRAGGRNLLFDAGRGVAMRLAASGLFPNMVDVVFLTHLHSDHTSDFNDLVTMNWAMSPEPRPLRVVGPPGTAEFCDLTKAMLARDIAWRIEHHADLGWEPTFDVTEVTDGEAYVCDGVSVTVAPTRHPPVTPTIGFRVTRDGRAVVVGGDSLPCEGLDRLCEGADVYVQTVLRAPLIEAVGSPRLREILGYHSSTTDAGRTAARAGVRTLVFTHMMPAPLPGTEHEWVDDARAHFSGEVVVGSDLMTIPV